MYYEFITIRDLNKGTRQRKKKKDKQGRRKEGKGDKGRRTKDGIRYEMIHNLYVSKGPSRVSTGPEDKKENMTTEDLEIKVNKRSRNLNL